MNGRWNRDELEAILAAAHGRKRQNRGGERPYVYGLPR